MIEFGLYSALALTLFLLVNWIGRHSLSRGYQSMSLLPRADEAPALNVAIRVLTPTAFILICATALYEVGYPEFVPHIYIVAALYVGFRWGFNILWDRRLLLNWPKEFVLAVIILAANVVVTRKVLRDRASLLPDPNEIINEVWILMGLYSFYVLNQIRLGDSRTIQRKQNHVEVVARRFLANFGDAISSATDNEKIQSLILAIMVFENFNRPRMARLLENAAGPFGLVSTFGLMQVASDSPISDGESVKRGIDRVMTAWAAAKSRSYDWDPEGQIQREMIKAYNPDDDYIWEIASVADVIEKRLYPGTRDRFADKEEHAQPETRDLELGIEETP